MTQRRKMNRRAILVVLLGVLAAGRAASQPAAKAQTAQAPRFTVDPLWPKPLPNRWILGSVVGVAVDKRDHVFVLNIPDYFNQRTEIGSATTPATGECCTPAPAVLEFDPEGALVASWGGPGSGYAWPTTPSGISVDNNGDVWIAGSGGRDTRILKFRRDGGFLAQFGKEGAAPTAPATPAAVDTAYAGVGGRGAAGRGGRGGGRGGRAAGPPPLAPNSSSTDSFGGAMRISFDGAANEAYVADGARNRRVAVIDMNTGAIRRFWGAYGSKPDDATLPPYAPDASPARQFGNPVQCAGLSKDGQVYVCDRTNDRIQVLRKDGTFLKEKTIAPRTLGDGSVWDIAFSADPQQKFLYVADAMNMRVYVLDRASLDVLTSFGDGGRQPGQFYGVHSIATDSKGNVYTGETYEGKRVQKFLFKGIAPVGKANAGVVWPAAGARP
jgi:DNA-binding beta-propeller fold protein YncE